MRIFLAIELPSGVRGQIAALQERLRSRVSGVRWTRADQIHLTVKFLGEVADADLSAVCDVAARMAAPNKSFELRMAGTGCFPPRGPVRIVWTGIPDPPAELMQCQRNCEEAFARLGFKPEGRDYHPHLTIGRVNDARIGRQVRIAVEQETAFAADSFDVPELVLFQSVLALSGPTYTVIARFPLLSR